MFPGSAEPISMKHPARRYLASLQNFVTEAIIVDFSF
jgi:hypothetical protein